MNPNDEVELHLTGDDAVLPQKRTVSVLHGHITHIEGEWVTVEFPRAASAWEICAAKSNFEQDGAARWKLSLD